MILFINARVADDREKAHPILGFDGVCSDHDSVDVFKYALASVAVIPFSTAIIYYELADNYADRRAEIDATIASLFPQAVIYPYRNERQEQWEEAMRGVFALAGEELVWYCCEADQVFIDYEPGLLERIEARLLEMASRNRYVSCYLSNWPVALPLVMPGSSRRATTETAECDEVGFTVKWSRADGVQIVNRNLLRHWWFAHDHGDAIMPQPHSPEGESVLSPDNIHCIVPIREMVRGFYGYAYAGVDPVTYPPLAIPAGFFSGRMKVRCGFRRRRAGWLHINPQVADHAAVSAEGVDWHGTLDDLPLFWRNRIARVATAQTSAAPEALHYVRDRALLRAALPLFEHLPAGLMRLLRPALRTTDTATLRRLHREACTFADNRIDILDANCNGYVLARYRRWVYAVAPSLGRMDIERLYELASATVPESYEWFVGDSFEACREFVSAHFALPCLERLATADRHRALELSLPDYVCAAPASAGPREMCAVDTWVYLRLVDQVIRTPERSVHYDVARAGIDQLRAALNANDTGGVSLALRPEDEEALAAAYAPGERSAYANPRQGDFANVASQANHLFNPEINQARPPTEYIQLLASILPSVSIALSNVQIEVARANPARAEALLREVLAGSEDSPFEYAAILCALTALDWTRNLFGDDYLSIPSVQQVYTLLRDLNCRRLATPGVQRALIKTLGLEDAAERALAYNRLGEALFALEQERGAELAFKRACLESPSVAVVYNNLAVLCWNRGQAADALAHLEAAIRIDPTDETALANSQAILAACA